MTRIILINNCDSCPLFDDEYHEYNGYSEECTHLERKIESVGDIHPIPDDCPLQKQDKEADNI